MPNVQTRILQGELANKKGRYYREREKDRESETKMRDMGASAKWNSDITEDSVRRAWEDDI